MGVSFTDEMKTKTKKQTDAEFVEKIKTIGVSTPKAGPKCHDCGKEMQFIGAGIGVVVRLHKGRSGSNAAEERAFAE